MESVTTCKRISRITFCLRKSILRSGTAHSLTQSGARLKRRKATRCILFRPASMIIYFRMDWTSCRSSVLCIRSDLMHKPSQPMVLSDKALEDGHVTLIEFDCGERRCLDCDCIRYEWLEPYLIDSLSIPNV